ncbi:MAG TPA: hypothetical protein VGQ76_25545 [Thermoanaerobaculia bacterium]|jgi:hydroxymethylpyrimidine pyrophosphatase-like HAD family hydrolase|nr:hypothetical protein [Thermoanaerobaculia bacterium]
MTNTIVFADLDFALLRTVVPRLHAVNVPLIPMTAMTLEEMIPIADELHLRPAMIIESGGGIARWKGTSWELEPCGLAADLLLDVVREIEDRTGASLSVHSVMPGSMPRSFSEPFSIETGDPDDVMIAAASLGFSVVRGDRLLHLNRPCDEGTAFTRLRNELRCDVAIAIGDSPLDADLLMRAEIPIILSRADGPDPDLLARAPHAFITPVSALQECLDAIIASIQGGRDGSSVHALATDPRVRGAGLHRQQHSVDGFSGVAQQGLRPRAR